MNMGEIALDEPAHQRAERRTTEFEPSLSWVWAGFSASAGGRAIFRKEMSDKLWKQAQAGKPEFDETRALAESTDRRAQLLRHVDPSSKLIARLKGKGPIRCGGTRELDAEWRASGWEKGRETTWTKLGYVYASVTVTVTSALAPMARWASRCAWAADDGGNCAVNSPLSMPNPIFVTPIQNLNGPRNPRTVAAAAEGTRLPPVPEVAADLVHSFPTHNFLCSGQRTITGTGPRLQPRPMSNPILVITILNLYGLKSSTETSKPRCVLGPRARILAINFRPGDHRLVVHPTSHFSSNSSRFLQTQFLQDNCRSKLTQVPHHRYQNPWCDALDLGDSCRPNSLTNRKTRPTPIKRGTGLAILHIFFAVHPSDGGVHPQDESVHPSDPVRYLRLSTTK
ncbi:hypothetical protein FB451DRAFT_1185993 [Mycena latifolia]|nr:hypothetical protein FB451DRAFT_1185993 [Mycena latifolia]